VPDPADRPAVNFRTLEQRLRTPDGRKALYTLSVRTGRSNGLSVEPISITLNGEQMTPCRAEMTSSGEVGDRCTAIHQVLWSLAMNTSVDHGCDIVTDTIRNVQPVELSLYEICQATVKLLSTADDTTGYRSWRLG